MSHPSRDSSSLAQEVVRLDNNNREEEKEEEEEVDPEEDRYFLTDQC